MYNPPTRKGKKNPNLDDFNAKIECLRTWLEYLEKLEGRSLLAHSNKLSISHVLNVSKKPLLLSWIMDSGTTDYVTDTSKFFNTNVPCPNNRKIIIADDSLTTVAGVGNIKINLQFTLIYVLHVPKLCKNLISITKLSQNLNCKVIFSISHSEFHDHTSVKDCKCKGS